MFLLLEKNLYNGPLLNKSIDLNKLIKVSLFIFFHYSWKLPLV